MAPTLLPRRTRRELLEEFLHPLVQILNVLVRVIGEPVGGTSSPQEFFRFRVEQVDSQCAVLVHVRRRAESAESPPAPASLDRHDPNVADFGLAKQTGIQKAGDDDTTLVTTDHTSAGVLLGTVGYMSPEQVRGEPVDARTDIFAFGAVLYEMLIGLRAFKRNSSAETMTAILKEEPSEMRSTGDPAISPGFQRVVRHCLEKGSQPEVPVGKRSRLCS